MILKNINIVKTAIGKIFIFLIAFTTLSPTLLRAQEYTPSPENLANREEFRNDRFGVFIHWGIYSMLAAGEWALNTQNLNYQEYAKLARGFYPARFDAAEWVSAIKASGAKYICITSRHHDGFSMFDSKMTDFDIMDATPFQRDILKELAQECEKQGIKLHFYYSLIDWSRVDAPRGRTGLRVGRPTETVDQDSYFEFMKGQLQELLTNYGDIRVIWFDGHWDQDEHPEFDWRYEDIYPFIHNIKPDCLIGNNHHINTFPGEDIQIFEKDLPGENNAGLSRLDTEISSLPLETCETMNDSWGYRITDKRYKDVPTLIRFLVRAAGKDANLLLNVGPRPDGTLPEIAVDHLRGIGEWMNEFGGTIYGTRGGEMTARDWGVMTRKDNIRYVHILSWKDDAIYVPFSAGKITKAKCVNDGSEIHFTQDNDGVLLKLGKVPDEVDYIVELTVK